MQQIFVNVGGLGYALNAISYLILGVLLLVSWKKSLLGGLLLAAVIIQIAWSCLMVYQAYTLNLSEVVLLTAEELRLIVWAVFLLEILRAATQEIDNKNIFVISYLAVIVLFLVSQTAEFELAGKHEGEVHLVAFLYVLLLSIFGLILTEQIHRNTAQEKRWAIKFLCIGVGLMFAYDLYMYSHAIIFDGIDQRLWNARGYVNFVIMPLLAISVARNPTWSFRIFVSRQVVFYSTGLIVVGAYMTVMAVGGYFIQYFGGEWGREAQVVFLAGAIVVLFVILSSGSLRAKTRLFMSKHFFENKYDYREEWTGFVQKLSHIDSPRYLKEQILQTVAMLMHSRGSILYLKDENTYHCASAWNTDYMTLTFDSTSPLVGFLNNREWIIDANECRDSPGDYNGLILPEELYSINAWLVIPLKHYYELIGFIVLLEPFVKVKINWEDRDLLKAIGKQSSSYIAFMLASDALADAEKFSAFNRLSAFVVHDMKNSVAQLDLIVKNAEKHSSNPEFIEDSFLTISNVVERMKKMLNQLKRMDVKKSDIERVEVGRLLEKIVAKCAGRRPVPEFNSGNESIFVNVEPDRFENVVEHLIANAQDATPEDGHVEVRMRNINSEMQIEISDSGCGMSAEFISNHLFKPFETTKGNAGMGVGVFEAKEFVKYYGGQLHVQSEPGVGTTFYLTLPVYVEGARFESKFG